MMVQIDSALSPLHLEFLSETGATVFERNAFATVAEISHIEDHEIVLQSPQLAFSATAVCGTLELAHETPTFVLKNAEIFVVDLQEHLVELLVADVVAETVALTIGAVAEIDFVLACDFYLDVIEHDGLHESVSLVHLVVGSVTIGIVITESHLVADDAIVSFMGGQPIVMITAR